MLTMGAHISPLKRDQKNSVLQTVAVYHEPFVVVQIINPSKGMGSKSSKVEYKVRRLKTEWTFHNLIAW